MEKQLAGFHVLDSQYALSQLPVSREAKELNVSNQDIVRIGNLCDVAILRKINLSFNKIQSLLGIDQLNQLRELLAYSCGIEDISNLSGLTKLEKVYLQHNKISSISNTFQQMSKLVELRLDKNKISKIEHLKECASLRKLNLGNNTLQSCEGIQGLQFLVELNLSNNNIKSILPLKGLPNLRELDISHNQLKSLDGIQYLIKLEIVKADHNHIVHLQIPNYGNGSASNSNSGNNSARTMNSNKKSNKALPPTKPGSSQSSLPEIEGPIISELYLSGNRIKSIKGLEMFCESLEILDLSFNQISIQDLAELSQSLKQLKSLTEIRFFNNPCVDNKDSPEFTALKGLLQENCSNLQAIDDQAILQHSKSLQQGSVFSMDTKEFHTWEKGGEESSLAKESVITSLREESKSDLQDDPSMYSSSESEDGTSSKKKGKSSTAGSKKSINSKGKSVLKASAKNEPSKESLELEEDEEEDDEDDPEKVNERLGLKVPKLTLKSILTEEEIQEKENVFMDLLNHTRDVLESTIFKFEELQKLNPEEQIKFQEEQKRLKLQENLSSPLPGDKRRNFKLKKDEKLSEKLLNALDKVLVEKVDVETKDPTKNSEEKESTSPKLPLPSQNDLATAKSSVLTDHEQPITINHIKLAPNSLGGPSSLNDNANSPKFDDISETASKSGKATSSALPPKSKFAEKSSIHKSDTPTSITSGKTIHGTKATKSDFLISNTFLKKNSTILYQNTNTLSNDLPNSKSLNDVESLESADFLSLKMSRKEKKLSYLQWMNIEKNEVKEERNGENYNEEFELTEENIKELSKQTDRNVLSLDPSDNFPNKISLDTALLLKQDEENEDDSSLQQYDDPLHSIPEIEEVSPVAKVDPELISKMYSKPHGIGFDTRYGIANNISLLLSSNSDELLNDIQQHLLTSMTPKSENGSTPQSSRLVSILYLL